MARQTCDKCDKHFLQFEQVAAGIRVKRERDGKLYYSVICPKCGMYDLEAY